MESPCRYSQSHVSPHAVVGKRLDLDHQHRRLSLGHPDGVTAGNEPVSLSQGRKVALHEPFLIGGRNLDRTGLEDCGQIGIGPMSQTRDGHADLRPVSARRPDGDPVHRVTEQQGVRDGARVHRRAATSAPP